MGSRRKQYKWKKSILNQFYDASRFLGLVVEYAPVHNLRK